MMKITTIGFASAILLGATLVPAAFSQDEEPGVTTSGPAFDAERRPEFAQGRHPRRGSPGPGNHRRGPGDNPMGLILNLDSDRDSQVSMDEFFDGRSDETDRIIDALDTDLDGRISLTEAEARPQRPQRLDRPERPEIDREEVIACVRETIADYDPPVEEAPADRFAEADSNADGYIDLAELSAWLEMRAHRLFERLDYNDDGFITLYDYADRREHDINLRRVIRACIDQQLNEV